MRFPFVGPLFTDSKLPKRMASGWVKINGIDTYISRGFGSSRHMSPRLLCRPEMTEILLVPKGALLADHQPTSAFVHRGIKTPVRTENQPVSIV